MRVKPWRHDPGDFERAPLGTLRGAVRGFLTFTSGRRPRPREGPSAAERDAGHIQPCHILAGSFRRRGVTIGNGTGAHHGRSLEPLR
jgi:hypothetical protein